ncbi:hypothetical protein OIU85_023195 [Salix viminalis]|uniref:Uncharacterized protein n=1 Tax=Salix viminalis TaxID=40686 RepID=A0A9Q0NHD1_SALVM|nr:hypothetical protein OIU85_023195 [Salix viminalis]
MPAPAMSSMIPQNHDAGPTQSSTYVNSGINELPQTSTSPLTDPRLGNLSVSGASLLSYMPPLMPPMVFSRQTTIPATPYGSTPTQQQGESPNVLQNLSIPRPLRSVTSSFAASAASTSTSTTANSTSLATCTIFSAAGTRGVYAKFYSNARPSITNAATTATPFCAHSLSSSAARTFSVKAAAS